MTPVNPPLPQFLTVNEVAAALRVSRATIYRLISAGALTGTRIGKSVRVTRDAVDEFLHPQARDAVDPPDYQAGRPVPTDGP